MKIEVFLKTMQLIANEGNFAVLIESAVEISLSAAYEVARHPEDVDDWLDKRKERAKEINKSAFADKKENNIE